MKQLTKIFLAGAAIVLALSSCNKIPSTGISSYSENEIHFGNAGILVDTKAFAEVTNSTLQTNGFKVAAVIDDDNSVMFNKAVTYSGGVYSVPGEHYYFPTTGTMSFYGVYPETLDIDVTDGVATIDYEQDADTDLVAAITTDVAKTSLAVNMDFEHLLSQVSVTAKGENTACDYKIKSVTITNADGGTYSFADDSWTPNTTTADYTVYSDGTGMAVSTSSKTTVGSAMSFVPGTVSLNVVWECRQKGKSTLVSSNDQSVSVVLAQGKHSTLNLTLPSNSSEVLFSTSIGAWNNENTDIEVSVSANDLSKCDIQGNNTATHNTANCYVVRGAGSYRLPLVFGNGIKDDAENTAAFTRIDGDNMSYFFASDGEPIYSAFIEKHIDNYGSDPIDGVQIVWMDHDNLVSDLAIEAGAANDLPCKYLSFEVNGNRGNAVIAITAAGQIVWSWHIWVYPAKLETVTYTDQNTDEFEFLNVPLGWTVYGKTVKDGSALLYQYGRKDPFPNGKYEAPQSEPTLYGANDEITIAETAEYMEEGISNPATFYKYHNSTPGQYNWFKSDANLNLWNAKQDDYNDDFESVSFIANQKTVYDPSPVGYCVPQMASFKALIQDYYDDVTDIYKMWDGRGVQFNSSFYLPAAGYRGSYDGSPFNGGSYGSCWSSSAYSTSYAWYLDFSCDDLCENGSSRASGYAVVPVPEFN